MKKRATITDVAKAANVSVASVSLFLNDKVGLSEETRDHIGQIVEKMGYVPRGQNSRRTKLDLVLVIERLASSAFADMFYGEIVQSMAAEAQALDYNLILTIIDQDEYKIQDRLESMTDLSGIIILGGGDITTDILEDVVRHGAPHIFVDTHLNSQPVNSILVDNIHGAYQATNFLIDQGYKAIACIQGPRKYSSLVERFHGYSLALIDAGIPLNTDLIVPAMSHGTPVKGYRETRALIESGYGFDAIFCVSDRTALGALQALREEGFAVPDDVGLVGFDDIADSAFLTPPLTTVNVPRAQIGRIAVQQLHQMIAGTTSFDLAKLLLYPSLVVRGSA